MGQELGALQISLTIYVRAGLLWDRNDDRGLGSTV